VCTRAVSALAHYLEEEGLATVAISLIRPQNENTKPPRALWVPFELGRPFGPPGDAAFQRRVILAALGMLERDKGPVIIEDFPDDDPRWQLDPGWRPPPIPAPPATGSAEALAAQLEAEIPQLRDAHQRWVAQYSRTAVGLCGLSISECCRYVADWLCGKAPPSPREAFSGPLMLRFAVDDVKAYYLEAAAAGTGKPSSRQLGDWFWNETAAGAAIHALREACLASEDDRLKLIAGNFLVPAARVRGTG
jgi:hypothetical protein